MFSLLERMRWSRPCLIRITYTDSSPSDTLQEPLTIFGDYIDERKEVYFHCGTEEGADELKKADLYSCVSHL